MDQTKERVSGAAAAAPTPPLAGPVSAAQVFPGESEMARLMRAMDWSQTPLGSVEQWPQSLRTAVSICLASRFPIVLWWGPDLVTLYNDGYGPMLGAKHPESLGVSARRVWAEIWYIIGPMLDSVLHESKATWSDDQFLPLERNGYAEECYFTFSYSPILDESGGVGGVFCAVTETTSRVLAERRARSARDLAAAVVDAHTAEEVCRRAAPTLEAATPDVPFAALYLLDADGRIARLASRVGLDDSGVAATFAPPVVDLTATRPSSDAIACALASVATKRQAERVALPALPWENPPLLYDCQLIPKTALVQPIAEAGQSSPSAMLVAGLSPMRPLDDAYQGYFDLLVSHLSAGLTAARAYEVERQRAEALAELDRAKTAFFSNVSHEFRTPLTLMLGPLSDLLADEDALPPGTHDQIEVVQRNGLRLAKLVNTLLDFSRFEAGRAQAAYAPTDLAALTTDLASAFRSLVERAGLRFVVECPPLPQEMGPVYVDRDMWEKIVLNLLSNAFKFTFTGEIAVTLRAVLPSPHGESGAGGEDTQGAVELEVRDTGVGIPVDELPRLFERFHRVQGARARTYEGSGIGLALVQELIHLHGGMIRVESVEGAGTRVVVRLPTGTAHLPAAQIGTPAALASTALGTAPYVREAERWLSEDAGTRAERGLSLAGVESAQAALTPEAELPVRIVLADDNADMRDYLRRLLGEHYAVEAVANGAAALAAIHRQTPDLVLADVMMPELDGFGLLRALREDPITSALPVILLSARAGEEATIEGLEAGADDYLIKPFSAREVLSRVALRLELARTRREVEARARELETAIEAVVDAVFIYDREGKIVRTNSAARTLFGLDAMPAYTEGSPQQRAALISVRDEQGRPLPAEESGLYRLLRGEALTGADALDVRLRVADGRELEVSITGAPLRDVTGAITGAIAISRDVTERKRLERQTSDALDALLRLAAAIVEAPDGDTETLEASAPGSAPPADELLQRLAVLCCQVLDSEQVAIIAVKPGTELLQPVAITGSSRDQERLFRAGFGDLSLTARFGPEITAQLMAGETLLIDVDSLHAHDPTRFLSRSHFLIAPMLSSSGLLGYVGVNFGDEARHYAPRKRALALAVAQLVGMVMERARLAREREESRARELAAEEASRRMNDFLGIASHELRTPLTSIMGNVQMAERALRPHAAETEQTSQPDKDSETQLRRAHTMLARTERQVRRLDRLVGDLLDMSRIQAGKLELRLDLCELAEIVSDAVHEQRTAWPGRSITLDLPRRTRLIVRADADRIEQVVTNYLTNALKYSSEGQPVAVRVRIPARAGEVRVEVRDHGLGLSVAQQRHLFEQFSRVPGIQQVSGSGVGLGLGLYICRTIVARHGGSFGVESAPGEGSTFWFTLPLLQVQRDG